MRTALHWPKQLYKCSRVYNWTTANQLPLFHRFIQSLKQLNRRFKMVEKINTVQISSRWADNFSPWSNLWTFTKLGSYKKAATQFIIHSYSSKKKYIVHLSGHHSRILLLLLKCLHHSRHLSRLLSSCGDTAYDRTLLACCSHLLLSKKVMWNCLIECQHDVFNFLVECWRSKQSSMVER